MSCGGRAKHRAACPRGSARGSGASQAVPAQDAQHQEDAGRYTPHAVRSGMRRVMRSPHHRGVGQHHAQRGAGHHSQPLYWAASMTVAIASCRPSRQERPPPWCRTRPSAFRRCRRLSSLSGISIHTAMAMNDAQRPAQHLRPDQRGDQASRRAGQCVVEHGGHEDAPDNGPGFAKTRPPHAQQLGLSPISARATMEVGTRKASMGGYPALGAMH